MIRSLWSTAGMNAEAKPEPLVATSLELQQRTDEERRRLLIEQNLQANLQGQRLTPLEAGDDAALDRVEGLISACSDRQARIQERLEILDRRLQEARALEGERELDQIAARAELARQSGIRLIEIEYAKQAKSLATILRKLALIDEAIDRDNRRLLAAGRKAVSKPNETRSRRTVRIELTERMLLGLGDHRHPLHDEVYPGVGPNSWFRKGTGESVPKFGEFDVATTKTVAGDSPDTLWAAIILPASGPQPLPHPDIKARNPPIWDARTFKPTSEDIEALHVALDATQKLYR